jgi:legumain
MNKFIAILALALVVSNVHADQWAVIVAGSNGYWNYRHQSDTCHAYQILKAHGYTADKIIHMAYDDIANNSQNPFPGKLYNKTNGSDVYGGCVIDYKGADVTPDNYLRILKGQSSATLTKVLKSTAADTVFLNFSDHGAPGLVAFPSQYLYATDLLAAIQFMWDNKMYSKLVYYLEACESGSMFANLPKTIKAYATSASNATESSWAYYCGADAVVSGTNIGSCLGDLYSIVWMEDTDKNIGGETLAAQYQTMVKLTTQSNPLQFGDLSWNTDTVSAWIGPKAATNATNTHRKAHMIDSRDIKLHYLIDRHAINMSENSMNELTEEIMMRKLFDNIFADIKTLHADVEVAVDTDFVCYKDLIEFFESACGKFTEYGLKYMRSFYDICQNKKEAVVEAKKMVIQSCSAGQLF